MNLTRVRAPREVAIRFIKSHGLGNDYLVLCSEDALDPRMVVRICDRHRGVGADGILEPMPGTDERYGLRIWNPDGSVAEKSGNGLRIFARFLRDHRGAPSRFEVDLPSDRARCEIHEDGRVTVDMGEPSFDAGEGTSEASIWLRPLRLGSTVLRCCAVNVGNPHCVVPFEENTNLDAMEWKYWGSQIENHEWFPYRTNVQFLKPLDGGSIEIRVWERGAGATLASGSSAVAAFAVARRLGWVETRVTVVMQGGTLDVEETANGRILQTGPVVEIGTFELGKRFSRGESGSEPCP